MENSIQSVYKNKDFLLLFTGGLVSRIGNAVHFIALTWFVLELTGSGSATGLIMFFSTLPGVIVSPLGGVVVDRINRKVLIVGMDIIRGLIVLWLSWYIYAGTAEFFHLAVATVLLALCGSFFNPAISATIPNLVQDYNLQKANSMEHFSANFTQVIGAALGGILIGLLGIYGIFLVNGITFLISAVSEMFIKIPPIKKEINPEGEDENSNFWQELKFGARFLYNNKAIFSLFTVALFLNFIASGSMMVGLPYIFKEILSVSSNFYGLAQSVFPAGALIGAIILNFVPEIKNYYRVFVATIGFEGILFVLIGIPFFPIFLNNYHFLIIYYFIIIILFIGGLTNTLINVPLTVILQRMIPDNLRGRIFGLLSSFSQGLVPISMAVTGFLFDIFPVYYIFMISGILIISISLLITRNESIKSLNSTRTESETQTVRN